MYIRRELRDERIEDNGPQTTDNVVRCLSHKPTPPSRDFSYDNVGKQNIPTGLFRKVRESFF